MIMNNTCGAFLLGPLHYGFNAKLQIRKFMPLTNAGFFNYWFAEYMTFVFNKVSVPILQRASLTICCLLVLPKQPVI